MKKWIVTILLISLVLTAMLTACKKKNEPNDQDQTINSSEEQLTEEEQGASTDSEDQDTTENGTGDEEGIVDGTPEEITSALFEAYQCKDYEKVLTQFTYNAMVKAQLSEDILVSAWDQGLASYGEYVSMGAFSKDYQGDSTVIGVVCKFEKGSVNFSVVFNKDNEIAGFNFAPYFVPGEQSENIVEYEVSFGSAEYPLSGTLTLPKDYMNCPMVILVHGSGPVDRDETVGVNKPFQEIAWELAKSGIGVLRYDKRTYTYGNEMATLSDFTVYDETIDDVRYAYDFLKQNNYAYAQQIYIAGHSLGGYLMPRIAEVVPEADGYILMAASARPIEDLLVEQINYISGLDGTISADEQSTLDYFVDLQNTIKNLDPAGEYSLDQLMNTPLSYWVDLSGYDPVATMQPVQKPILVLQGDRDYQVTMTDYNLWKNGLSGIDITFNLYDGLNHIFAEGTEDSTPDEYYQQKNVSEKVIADIVSWIMNH